MAYLPAVQNRMAGKLAEGTAGLDPGLSPFRSASGRAQNVRGSSGDVERPGVNPSGWEEEPWVQLLTSTVGKIE